MDTRTYRLWLTAVVLLSLAAAAQNPDKLPASDIPSDAPKGVHALVSPSEPHGQVVGGVDLPSESIFAVEFKAVNGRELPFASFPNSIWLTPGRHEIKALPSTHGFREPSQRSGSFGFHSTFNLQNARGLRTGQDQKPTEPLVLDVEEGMVYYVGLKAAGTRPDHWELVVWKTESRN